MPTELPANLPPIAVIDIGTNSIHLEIAKLDSKGNFTILDSDKAVLRLGDALTPEKTFTDEAIARTIATIRHMMEIASSYQPIYRAVATHATRVARNHQELFQAIYDETGLHVALIDGVEEARLASLGMQHGLSLEQKTFLGVDIGGGSTEIIICNKENIHYVASVHLGALILSRKYLQDKKIKKQNIRDLEQDIALSLAPFRTDVPQLRFDCAVVCSGAAKTLALMHAQAFAAEKLSDPNGYQLGHKDLEKLNNEIQSVASPAKIKEQWKLDSNRAEIILAGSAILTLLTRFFRVEKWLISTYGLREGLVIDTISRLQSFKEYNPLISDVRWKNIIYLGDRYQIDRQQAQQVTKLALTIYDQLPPKSANFSIREQGAHLSDRDILRAAAWLYECGKFINHSRYHRHSCYLIMNSRMMGYSEKERCLIGLVTRFQRKGKAQKKGYDCRELLSKDLERVNYLASILRIAVAANRSRQGLIAHIAIRLADKEALFMVESKDATPPEVDLFKIRKEKKALEEMLGKAIILKLKS